MKEKRGNDRRSKNERVPLWPRLFYGDCSNCQASAVREGVEIGMGSLKRRGGGGGGGYGKKKV